MKNKLFYIPLIVIFLSSIIFAQNQTNQIKQEEIEKYSNQANTWYTILITLFLGALMITLMMIWNNYGAGHTLRIILIILFLLILGYIWILK